MHSSCVLLQEAFAATRADLNILTQVGDRWWKQRLRLHCEMPRADQLAVLFHLSVCSICAERLKRDCCDSLDCPWSAKVVKIQCFFLQGYCVLSSPQFNKTDFFTFPRAERAAPLVLILT